MSHVLFVAASKGEPHGQVWPWGQCLSDCLSFGQRRQCFKRKQIGLLRRVCHCQNLNSLAMKIDKFAEGNGVVAVVLRTVVEHCTERPKGCSNQYLALGKLSGSCTSQRDRTKKRSVGLLRRKTKFRIASARHLVAGSFDTIRPRLDVRAMNGNDLLWLILQHMRGPQRTINIGAEILKLGSHPSIEHAYI